MKTKSGSDTIKAEKECNRLQVRGFPLDGAQSREWERASFRDVTKPRQGSERRWNKQSGRKG